MRKADVRVPPDWCVVNPIRSRSPPVQAARVSTRGWTRSDMSAPGSQGRRFNPTRVIAIAIIAFLGVGLGWLRFAPDTAPVSVPMGAQAGQLKIKPCTYATDDGSYAADCGTLVVPENRANSRS